MIDAFQTGSAVAPRDRSVRNFLTFNKSDDANRVQDILTALAWLNAPHTRLIGLGKSLCDQRKTLGQFAAHADSLRALARKQKRNFKCHFTSILSRWGLAVLNMRLLQIRSRSSAVLSSV